MLPKPETCSGCPLYGTGEGFVPDELVEGAPVLVLAQNPGEWEELGERVIGYEWAGRRRIPLTEPNPTGPAPLIGPTGLEMERTYFPLARLTRGKNVSLANILKCRQIIGGRRTNDLPKGAVLAQAVSQCTAAHLRIPDYTKLIVAMGAHAAKWTGCPGSVSEWRGFCYPWSK